MNNETGKLSFDKLFLLSGIYALFYTFCLYRNRMGLTFPVFVLGTAVLFLYYLRLTARALKAGSALYLGGIQLLGLNVCLTSNEIVRLRPLIGEVSAKTGEGSGGIPQGQKG